MITHKQTDVTRKSGNCLQACVATLLGLSMDNVPNFLTMTPDRKPISALEDWLRRRGLALLSFSWSLAVWKEKSSAMQGTLGVYGFAAVKSKRHTSPQGLHSVVWRMDRKGNVQLFWDPDPDPESGSKWRFATMTHAIRLYIIVPTPDAMRALSQDFEDHEG